MKKTTVLGLTASSLMLLSASSFAGISIDSSRVIFQAVDNTTGKSVGVTSALTL